MLKIQCKAHPDYKGKLEPKVDCNGCFTIWDTRAFMSSNTTIDVVDGRKPKIVKQYRKKKKTKTK